jgi:cytidylate kinase
VSNDIDPAVKTAPRGLVVALDGPSSSGKSTVGVEAARRLGYRFCDTGLLYRAVTWLAVDRDVPSADVAACVALVAEIMLLDDGRGRLRHVEAAGRDVTSLVRGPEVDRSVSEYSKVPEVRAALLGRQREIASSGGIIMAGRDIGTVVLPDADVKVYLDASAEVRATRRAAQRRIHDRAEIETILADLRRRDSIDSTRETAPLRAAPDAVVINTDHNTFHESVAALVRAVRDKQRTMSRHLNGGRG